MSIRPARLSVDLYGIVLSSAVLRAAAYLWHCESSFAELRSLSSTVGQTTDERSDCDRLFRRTTHRLIFRISVSPYPIFRFDC